MTPRGHRPSPSRCAECAARLAADQRYCLECGARRWPLPGHIARLIQRSVLAAAVPRRPAAAWPAPPWLRAPRAAAVAVMGTLSFGALVGSLVAGSSASVLTPIVVAVRPHTAAPVPAAAEAGGGRSGGGESPATITITSPAPPTPSPSPTVPAPAVSSPAAATPVTGNGLPAIKHVFLIVLSGAGFNQTFVHTEGDTYLGRTLTHQGELVQNYYAVAGGPLANEIAILSGQGPTPDTVADCPAFDPVLPGARAARGQILGHGCIYPARTRTLAGQLTAAHLSWRVYLQAPRLSAARAERCAPARGASPPAPTPERPYAAWRNPFLFFRALVAPGACLEAVTALTRLRRDLRSPATTPALSYLIADTCHDGQSCPGSTPSADAFLKRVVPEIRHSAAYRSGGLIVITFDNAPQTGPSADTSSCCDDPTYPNLPPPAPPTMTTTTTSTAPATTTTDTTTTTTATPSLGSGVVSPTGGGGQVGLLLLSPFVSPGTADVTDYFNHFSLLGSLEALFGLRRLGYAADPSLPVFGAGVFNRTVTTR